MNYYERYCGDYVKKTAHLSLTEHGAYTMMLDTYYSTERPLPAGLDLLYRICRAMNKVEQIAVAKVADEFFPVSEDGLRHQVRADQEIASAQPRIAAARANGKFGGRRKTKPTKNPLGFQQEPTGNPLGSPSATQTGEAFPQAPYPKPKATPKNISANAAAFAAFWDAYPIKKEKKSALKTWVKLSPDQELIDRIMIAVERQSEEWARSGTYPPYPTTWLNGERWDDEITALQSRIGSTANAPTLAEKRVQNMAALTGKSHDNRSIESTAKRVGDASVLPPPGDLREPNDDDVGRR